MADVVSSKVLGPRLRQGEQGEWLLWDKLPWNHFQEPHWKPTLASFLLLHACCYPFPIWSLPSPALQQEAPSLPTGFIQGGKERQDHAPHGRCRFSPRTGSTYPSAVSLLPFSLPVTGQNLPELGPHAAAKWTNDALSLLHALTCCCSLSCLGIALTHPKSHPKSHHLWESPWFPEGAGEQRPPPTRLLSRHIGPYPLQLSCYRYVCASSWKGSFLNTAGHGSHFRIPQPSKQNAWHIKVCN